MSKLDDLVTTLSGLTNAEAAELSKQLEKTWGVSASTPVPIPSQTAPASLPTQAPEPTNFNVMLMSFPPDKKMAVIKAVRELVTGMDLATSKKLVETAPKAIGLEKNPVDAQTFKKKLEDAGATVELQPA